MVFVVEPLAASKIDVETMEGSRRMMSKECLMWRDVSDRSTMDRFFAVLIFRLFDVDLSNDSYRYSVDTRG